jgi:hypothetical protein
VTRDPKATPSNRDWAKKLGAGSLLRAGDCQQFVAYFEQVGGGFHPGLQAGKIGARSAPGRRLLVGAAQERQANDATQLGKGRRPRTPQRLVSRSVPIPEKFFQRGSSLPANSNVTCPIANALEAGNVS